MPDRRSFRSTVVVAVTALFIGGCGAPAAAPAPTPTADTTPGQVRGTLSASGQSYKKMSVGLLSRPLPATNTGSTETPQGGSGVAGISVKVRGAFVSVVDTQITARPDSAGAFLLRDVPAGEYILYFKIDPFFNYYLVEDDKGEPRAFQLAPGQTLDLGTILVR